MALSSSSSTHHHHHLRGSVTTNSYPSPTRMDTPEPISSPDPDDSVDDERTTSGVVESNDPEDFLDPFGANFDPASADGTCCIFDLMGKNN
jgi:hypothetical protein